jgi:tripartite-type tricarboxylate transporter receptor subunit TctC
MGFVRSAVIAASAVAISLGAFESHAQEYPKKAPIRIIAAQGAGSATDIMARALAARMGEVLGQQIVVENRPGAGGLIGTEAAAKANNDGYTLAIANISTHGVNPSLYKKLPYDPIKDFEPISMTATTGNVLIVHDGLPFKSVAELIAYAKANPGKLTYASAGQGSSQHLVGALFGTMAGGLDMVHVPYKGTQPGLAAVMSGEVNWMLPSIPSGMTAIRTGKARPLGVSTTEPHPELPNVPLMNKDLPGFVVTTWFALVAPAGTPKDIIKTLNAAVAKALQHPDTKRLFAGAGLEPTASTPEELTAHIKSEIERWSKVVKDAKIPMN